MVWVLLKDGIEASRGILVLSEGEEASRLPHEEVRVRPVQEEAVLGIQARRTIDNVIASVIPSTGGPGFALFGVGLAAMGGVGLYLRRIGRRRL